jgi:hypothetical protein
MKRTRPGSGFWFNGSVGNNEFRRIHFAAAKAFSGAGTLNRNAIAAFPRVL